MVGADDEVDRRDDGAQCIEVEDVEIAPGRALRRCAAAPLRVKAATPCPRASACIRDPMFPLASMIPIFM
jgi:hypothetical protein